MSKLTRSKITFEVEVVTVGEIHAGDFLPSFIRKSEDTIRMQFPTGDILLVKSEARVQEIKESTK